MESEIKGDIMQFKIEKMTLEDKSTVKVMMRDFYSSEAVLSNGSEEIFDYDVEECAGDSPYAEGYVFKNNDMTLGYAMLAKSYSTEFGRRCIWIEDIYIKSKYRGEGIGRAFFEMLFSKYPEAVFRLEAEKENTAAMAVYEKCGFDVLPYVEMLRL